MDLEQIRTEIDSENPQDRMRALVALRQYDPEVAVPILISTLQDPEAIVRSFATIGLGLKKNAEAFAALVELMGNDQNPDPNLMAEAANSLAQYGQAALPHLMRLFLDNDHWLIRLSILPVLVEMDCPAELFELCGWALKDEDETVRESAIEHLAKFAGSPVQEIVLEELLPLAQTNSWRIRRQLALSLRNFDHEQARSALLQLQQDADYRVVGAVLEGSLFHHDEI
jgi:HEAT repeat protein